jgi:biotin carboxylase
MSNFLLIGKSFFRLREYLDEHNHVYITLLDKNLEKSHKTDDTVLCDFSSVDSMIETAKNINKTFKLDGVFSIYENYILPTAQIADALGLPGLPLDSAKACTDKELMREMFNNAPEQISPDFTVVRSTNDLIDFANSHKFPLILKPANLVKSLLVTKANNLDELIQQYQSALGQIDSIYRKYAPNRDPKMLVEEFIEGKIYSVDAFIDEEGSVSVLDQIVDYQTGHDIGYNDNFHYSRLLPSELSPEKIQALRHTAKIGCESLGMKSSPAHIEIIYSQEGPRIVEIGARNGGYRERMHDLANGIDILGNALKLSLGEKTDIKATKNESCVVLELFPYHSGIFTEISHVEELKHLESLKYFSQKRKVGDIIGKSSEGHKTAAIIILHNSNKEQFDKDYRFVNDNVKIITKL